MQERSKLLMLITNSGTGGAEHVFYQHASTFSAYYDVTECYFSLERGKPLTQNKIIELRTYRGRSVFVKIYNLFSRINQIRSIKKEGNYAVCISHMDGANWLNVLSFSKTKTILCIHGSLTRDRNRGFFFKKFLLNRVIVPFIYKKANAVVCVSNHIKEELKTLIGKKKFIYSIPNFFDLEKIAQLKEAQLSSDTLSFFDNHEVLCVVGRLAPEKNFISLIRLFKVLSEVRPQVRLIFIGDGPMRPAILSEISSLGLSYGENLETEPGKTVYLLGLQKNPFQFVAKSKALLLTSYNEGFPLVLGEAMVCCTPVISYDCISGPRQIIAPELDASTVIDSPYWTNYGILMPMQKGDEITHSEIAQWSKVLCKLFDNPSAQIAIKQKAYKRALTFSKQSIIKHWLNLIEDVRKGRNKSSQ